MPKLSLPLPSRATVAYVLIGVGIGLAVALLPSASQAAGRPAPAGLSSQARIMDDVEQLVDLGPRRTGTPGGDRAAEYVGQGLRDAGIPKVWEDHATSYQWEATGWSLSAGGESVDAFPATQSFFGADRSDWTGTFSTGPSGRIAQVVDIRGGTALSLLGKDLRGKVVLFDLNFQLPQAALGLVTEFLYDPQLSLLKDPASLLQGNPYLTNYVATIREAQKRGAVGFIGILDDYFDSNRYRNEYYRRLNVTIPGFWVTKGVGAQIRKQVAARPTLAKMKLEGRRWEATTRTVLGYLPGQSRETVMVQSHHDSLGPGAVEDASGTASVLAQARYFAKLPLSQRPRSLLFTTFDSHFTGYQAHMDFITRYLEPKDTPIDIVANATIEHIAKQGVIKNGQLQMRDLPEPRGIFRSGGPEVKRAIVDAVRKYDLQRLTLVNSRAVSSTASIPTDASFISEFGIPTISYISGPVYLYDDLDTIDKVDASQVVPVNAAFVDIIDRLQRIPLSALGRR